MPPGGDRVPYDTVIWAEVTQNNGLAGVAALAGQSPFLADGDTLKMPKKKYVAALGGSSLTKPNGCALSGDKSRGGQRFHANAAISMGLAEILKDFALDFQENELVTALLNNTNVSEESQVFAHVVDESGPFEMPKSILEAGRKAGARRIHCPIAKVTVATTKTMFNGEVALDAAITAGLAGQNAGWLSSEKEYAVLGLMHSVATTAFGTVHIRGLAGGWEGRFPGIPMYGKLLGTFDDPVGAFMPALEPIPFKGNSLPLISEVGLVAAAHTFGIVIGEK
jgi:hypothetical protein